MINIRIFSPIRSSYSEIDSLLYCKGWKVMVEEICSSTKAIAGISNTMETFLYLARSYQGPRSQFSKLVSPKLLYGSTRSQTNGLC